MSERKQGFVGYEYREISVTEYLSFLSADSYPCFEWKIDNGPVQSKTRHLKSRYVDLRFKKDDNKQNGTYMPSEKF